MLKSKHDLSRVKPGPWLVKLSCKRHMVEKFAAINEFHHHIQVIGVLESVLKLHDERVLDSLHNFALSLNALLLIRAIDELFLDYLHCVVFAGLLVLHEENFTVGAMPHHFQKAEVILASRVFRSSILRRILLSLQADSCGTFSAVAPLDSLTNWNVPRVHVSIRRVATGDLAHFRFEILIRI